MHLRVRKLAKARRQAKVVEKARRQLKAKKEVKVEAVSKPKMAKSNKEVHRGWPMALARLEERKQSQRKRKVN